MGCKQKDAEEIEGHREASSRRPRAARAWAELTLAMKGKPSKYPKVIDLTLEEPDALQSLQCSARASKPICYHVV